MTLVNVAVEGVADAVAARKLLRAAGHEAGRVVVKRGKTELDPLVPKLNRAAAHLPWLVLRDADRDAGGCAARLPASLLPHGQADQLSVRLPVRSLEAWLLADADAFAEYFRVRPALLSAAPEDEPDAKRALVRTCKRSRSRLIRDGMGRQADDRPGPEYTALLTTFVREAWDPTRAAAQAPSLVPALADVSARFRQTA